MKERCENGLKVLLRILADQSTKADAKIWHAASTPVWTQGLKNYKTVMQGPEEVRHMYLHWARGGYGETVQATWDTLNDTDTLRNIGLVMELEAGEGGEDIGELSSNAGSRQTSC